MDNRLQPAVEGFRDRSLAQPLVQEIHRLARELGREIRIMEVCGTHTVALRREGIRSLLPENILMISGPGCPVCVTPAGYIDNALSLLAQGRAAVASFGDLIRVPGTGGDSLSRYLGTRRVRIVYSPSELPALARETEGPLVFLGIGFETTAPAVASVFLRAKRLGLGNLLLYSALKTIPPALKALLASADRSFDAFLLPGHVSVIIGEQAYRFLEDPGGVPGVIAGFEPLDLLAGILQVLRLLRAGARGVENAYTRAVRPEGNPRALETLHRLLEPCAALWRGLGELPGSGLRLREEFSQLDAATRFRLPELESREPAGCLCARVLTGRSRPEQCPLFAGACTPQRPAGACMVSSEGACAAHYRYGEEPV